MSFLERIGRKIGLYRTPRDAELEERLPAMIAGVPATRISGDAIWATDVEPSSQDFISEVAEAVGVDRRALSVAISVTGDAMVRAWRWRGADAWTLWDCVEQLAALGVAPVGTGDQLRELAGVRVIRTFSGGRTYDGDGRLLQADDPSDALSFVKGDTWFEVSAADDRVAEGIIEDIAGPMPRSTPTFALTLPDGWRGSPLRPEHLWTPDAALTRFADAVGRSWSAMADTLRPSEERPLFGPLGAHSSRVTFLAVDLRSGAEGRQQMLAVYEHLTAYDCFEDEIAAKVEIARSEGVQLAAALVELPIGRAAHLTGRVDGDPCLDSSQWIVRAGPVSYGLLGLTHPSGTQAIDDMVSTSFWPMTETSPVT